MTLALGLAATFIGVALVIAGYTGKPLPGLLFGHWDSGGGDFGPGGGNFGGGDFGATADTGGTHAPPKTGSGADTAASPGRNR